MVADCPHKQELNHFLKIVCDPYNNLARLFIISFHTTYGWFLLGVELSHQIPSFDLLSICTHQKETATWVNAHLY